MSMGRKITARAVTASPLVRETTGRRIHQCVAELQNSLSQDAVGSKTSHAVTGQCHGVQIYWRLLKAKTTLQEVCES